jgi:CRP-like cAMP-binding protein
MFKNSQFSKLKNQTRMIFSSKLLKDLSTTERYEFLQLCHRRKYNQGEYIYYQDDPGTGMYFIEEGSVELIVTGNNSDGKNSEKVTFKLSPPDSFGALSIGYDLRRLSSAKCITDCTLLGFFNPDFETLKKRNPSIAVKFLEKISTTAMRQLERTVRELEKVTSIQNVFSIQFQTYYERDDEENQPSNTGD